MRKRVTVRLEEISIFFISLSSMLSKTITKRIKKRGPGFESDKHGDLAIKRKVRRLNEDNERVTAKKVKEN